MKEEKRKQPIISVVGAGGKTSFISKTAEWYEEQGQKVIITTTTHIRKQARWKSSYTGALEELKELLESEQIIVAGIPCGNEKIKGLKKEVFDEIVTWGIPILIEADGAKHMPCKAPREHEPVIIPQTNIVVAVVGLDAVHKPIKDSCYCAKEVADLLNCSEEKKLSCEDVKTLMLSPNGMKKGVTEFMDYWIILNKADSKQRMKDAKEIERLLSIDGMTQVRIASLCKNLFYSFDSMFK